MINESFSSPRSVVTMLRFGPGAATQPNSETSTDDPV